MYGTEKREGEVHLLDQEFTRIEKLKYLGSFKRLGIKKSMIISPTGLKQAGVGIALRVRQEC